MPVRLESWSWGASGVGRRRYWRLSGSLNGVAVLRTMVERRVQPLKLWERLLCDYARVGDPTQETREGPKAGEVTKRVAWLVIPAIVVGW